MRIETAADADALDDDALAAELRAATTGTARDAAAVNPFASRAVRTCAYAAGRVDEQLDQTLPQLVALQQQGAAADRWLDHRVISLLELQGSRGRHSRDFAATAWRLTWIDDVRDLERPPSKLLTSHAQFGRWQEEVTAPADTDVLVQCDFDVNVGLLTVRWAWRPLGSGLVGVTVPAPVALTLLRRRPDRYASADRQLAPLATMSRAELADVATLASRLATTASRPLHQQLTDALLLSDRATGAA